MVHASTNFLRLCTAVRCYSSLLKKQNKQTQTVENELSAPRISYKSMGHWICISDSFNWLITIHADTEFCFAILIRPKRNSQPTAL